MIPTIIAGPPGHLDLLDRTPTPRAIDPFLAVRKQERGREAVGLDPGIDCLSENPNDGVEQLVDGRIA